MRQAYFIVGLILGLAIAVFSLQNTALVEVRFLAWQATGSLAAVVLASEARKHVSSAVAPIPALPRVTIQRAGLFTRVACGPTSIPVR